MLFYLCVIGGSTLFAFMSDIDKKKHRYRSILFFIISAVIMFLPLAMRDCGADYTEYQRTYSNIVNSGGWISYWHNYEWRPEPLYSVLNFAAYYIFDSFYGVNVLCALITIGFTFTGLYKFRKQVNLGVTVWCVGFLYYIMMFGLNRIMIAVALVTWAYHFYTERKKWWFFLFCIIAGLFHYAAFLMVVFYFVLRWMERPKENSNRIRWLPAIVSVAGVFLVMYLVIPRLFGSWYAFARYEGYFTLSFSPSALNNGAGCYLLVVLLIIFWRRINMYLKENKEILTMGCLGIVLAVACTVMPIHRIVYFFFPAAALLYGTVPCAGICKQFRGRITYFAILAIMGILWIYNTTVLESIWADFVNPYVWARWF